MEHGLVKSINSWRQSTGYQQTVVGRICWRGTFSS